MARDLLASLPFLVLLETLIWLPALAKTDKDDVGALNVMYVSMNSPSQLTGWKRNGGDPCGDSWKGIECSGSSVTELKLSSLGLSGSLGYQLSNMKSATHFDLSKNNFQGDIPYQLPPNLDYLDLSGNSFTGGVPYSISQMSDLKYLNLAQNRLSGQLSDMFGKLPKLSEMDMSLNRLTGNLPQSFASLSSLKTLNLRNNQFTGPIDVLAKLSLENLDIRDNQFTGWIPNKLKKIDDIETSGNHWSTGPAPPGSSGEASFSKSIEAKKKSGTNAAVIAGIVIAVVLVTVLLFIFIKRRLSSSSKYIDRKSNDSDDQLSRNRSFSALVPNDFKELNSDEPASSIDVKPLQTSSSSALKPEPSARINSFDEFEFVSKFNSKRSAEPLSVAEYSFMDLQAATGSFSPSRLLGEGSIGCVYKAKYADGKILAVKKVDPTKLPGNGAADFMEVVSDITRLRHSNISELVGYCVEPGQHLLVYDFQMNGSLHDFLHLSEEYRRPMTWDTRVKIALGTARAIEYLHEACSPPLVHKNIKSANVLLDAELNPRLADCGFAGFYQHTSHNLGPGYNAPECTRPIAYTLKSDVYSFGVVMLEVLTGRKPYDSSKPRSEQILVHWASLQLHDIDMLSRMVDPGLRGLYPPKSLSRFADVIALCVQSEPKFRPPMSEVVESLARCIQRPNMKTSREPLGPSRLSSASRRSDWSEDSDHNYYQGAFVSSTPEQHQGSVSV